MAFTDRTRDYWDMLRKKRFGSRQSPPPPSRGQFAPQAYDQMFMGTPAGQNPIGADPPVIGQAQAAGWRGPTAGSPYNTRPQQARQFMNAAPLASQNVMPDIGQTLAQARRVGSGIQTPEKKQSPGLLKRIGAATASGGGAMSAAASRPGASFWEALGAFGPEFSKTYTENERYRAEQEQEAREEARIVEDRGIAATERQRLETARLGLEGAVTSIGETGGLTPTQLNQIRQIALSDPGAAMQLANQYESENKTGTFTGRFLEGLEPEYREDLEGSGQIALLNAPNSVFSTDQKLDLILTHGTEISRRANAIDPLLERIYNLDDRTRATPEQLEHAKYIAKNPQYAELMLRSPIHWDTLDTGPGGEVQYWRDDKLITTANRADDPMQSGVLDSIEEGYNLISGRGGRAALYQYKRALEAVERIHESAFDNKNLLRKGWDVFTQRIRNSPEQRTAHLAELENAWQQLGFENLSVFVGPTSDYEFGIASALNGSMALSKEALKRHMRQMYRIKLTEIAEHNNLTLSSIPENQQGLRDRYLVRLHDVDLDTKTREYYEGQLGTPLSSPGHAMMLSGERPFTGALVEESGPDDAPKPQNEWVYADETRTRLPAYRGNVHKWELRDPYGRGIGTEWNRQASARNSDR